MGGRPLVGGVVGEAFGGGGAGGGGRRKAHHAPAPRRSRTVIAPMATGARRRAGFGGSDRRGAGAGSGTRGVSGRAGAGDAGGGAAITSGPCTGAGGACRGPEGAPAKTGGVGAGAKGTCSGAAGTCSGAEGDCAGAEGPSTSAEGAGTGAEGARVAATGGVGVTGVGTGADGGWLGATGGSLETPLPAGRRSRTRVAPAPTPHAVSVCSSGRLRSPERRTQEPVSSSVSPTWSTTCGSRSRMGQSSRSDSSLRWWGPAIMTSSAPMDSAPRLLYQPHIPAPTGRDPQKKNVSGTALAPLICPGRFTRGDA
jgi:hypothetical protein